MIRVFLIALLALGALFIVARQLPPRPASAAAGISTAEPDPSAGPFAPWDGVWEGTFSAYEPDGSVASRLHVRQEYASVSPQEQTVRIVDRTSDGAEKVSTGSNVARGERLECRIDQAGGPSRLLIGRQVGRAIVWHRKQADGGLEEAFREEITRTASGDLYTIDGFGIYGADRSKVLLFEGRYRRVASPAP